VHFSRFRHSPRRVLSEGGGPSAFGPYASQEVGHQMASWYDRQQGDGVYEWGWRCDVHHVYWSVEECLEEFVPLSGWPIPPVQSATQVGAQEVFYVR
jgi:hypothetical protein